MRKKGNTAIDLDDTDLCFWVNVNTGEKTKYTEGAGPEWLENNKFRANVKGLQKLLEKFTAEKNVYIGGKIATTQLKEVFVLFDKVFLLRPSDNVLVYRQSTRTNKGNKFAKNKEEQEHLLKKRKGFEDACLTEGAILIDANKSVQEILKEVAI